MPPDTTGARPLIACAFVAASAVLIFPVATSSAGVTPPDHLHNTTARISATRTDALDTGISAGTRASLVWQEQRILQQYRRERPAVKPKPRPKPVPAPTTAAPQPAATTPAPPPSSPAPTQAPATTAPPPIAVSGTPQEYAQSLMGQYGWDDSQMSCLIPLWNNESGWNLYASNPSSGAYGIPQALPGDKMAAAGADWQTDADTQIRWGLGLYIKPVYGTPCAAWAHEEADGWY